MKGKINVTLILLLSILSLRATCNASNIDLADVLLSSITVETNFFMPIGSRTANVATDLVNSRCGATDTTFPGEYIDDKTGTSYHGWYVFVEFNCNLTSTGEDYSNGAYHPGEDWNGNGGNNTDEKQPVYAIANGIVIGKISDKELGNVLFILHKTTNSEYIVSAYYHLCEINNTINLLSCVDKTTRVGTIGKTGLKQGTAHLHWEIRKESFLEITDTVVRLKDGRIAKNLFNNTNLVSILLNNKIIVENTNNSDYVYFRYTIKTEVQLIELLNKIDVEKININEMGLVVDIWRQSICKLLTWPASIYPNDSYGQQNFIQENYYDPAEFILSHQSDPNILHVPQSHPTIQSAIDAASAGQTVLVDTGTYYENISFNSKAITVKSLNGATNTIINGNANGSVITFNSGETLSSVLDGFTITNGNSVSSSYIHGGGIYCNSSSPTIINCTITGNTARSTRANADGGGIYCVRSSPVITNCTISNNRAFGDGGGIQCTNYSSPIITNCIINNNSVYWGGGICSYFYSSPTIINSIINSNSAYGGGGICCHGYASATIINSTITENTASYGGGGLWCDYNTPNTVTIINSILWGNTAAIDSTSTAIYPYGVSNVTVTNSDIQGGWAGIGNINFDPLFVGGGNYHLTPDSPCIDTGTSTVTGLPVTDIDGDIRPQGASFDIGADEFKP